MISGEKILVTGVHGAVAFPLASALALDNEVWGVARFNNPQAQQGLEQAGVRCAAVNLAVGDFSALPTDFDYVVNLAVAKTGALGPMSSVYFRDPDGNLIEISNYPE